MQQQPGFALPARVRLEGRGLRLREWTDEDLPLLAGLFDDPDIARWTPIVSPFDIAAAREYLARARAGRAEGRRLQLAITEDGSRPLGEILLFPSESDSRDAELGYGVGRLHRGRALAARAVRVMTDYAYQELAARRVVLRIEAANTASRAVARAAGFELRDDEPALVRGSAGRYVELLTWCHRR